MIVKALRQDYASVVGKPRWVYYDHIERAENLGYVTPADQPGNRISCNERELREWVDRAWGTERRFSDELWPEFPDAEHSRNEGPPQLTVTCLHLTRDDGTMILALVADETYLLSDEGKTVDRLH